VEGSLLAGSLRPHEVEWYASCSKGVYEMLDPDAAVHVRVEKAAAMSEMLGHITWILAAQVALSCLLELSQDFYQRSLLPGNERLQWEAPAGYIAFISQAADLAMAPRPVLAGRPRHSAFLEMTTLPQELMLTRDLQHVANTCSSSNTLFYPLCAVWRRWEASGVLARRSEEGEVAQMGEVLDQLRPTCALPGCGRREEGLKKCGASPGACTARLRRKARAPLRCSGLTPGGTGSCKQVYYCSKDHQTEHWPVHRKECKKATKAGKQATH